LINVTTRKHSVRINFAKAKENSVIKVIRFDMNKGV